MPRGRYSQRRADEMLTKGRVFLLRLSENLKPTEAYAIVTGREDGVVDYSFLDSPGANQAGVARLYPRILEIGEVREDYLKQIETGKKVELPLPALLVEEPVRYDGEILSTDISQFSGERAEVYRKYKEKFRARRRRR